MANTDALQAFLVGKSFMIPTFQRDYAWETKQIDELFSDIQEAMESDTSHYLGTIVLTKPYSPFEVVDGQQRLSTLILMIQALLTQLDVSDPVRIAHEHFLLKDGEDLKLNFGPNQPFVADLLASRNPTPKTRGQRRLAEAYSYCLERARAIHAGPPGSIHRWLQAIGKLEIISFEEADTGRAITIFQSVNDRGRPLTDMEKSKALLMLYSSRCLGGELDNRINEEFHKCFVSYDRITELAGKDGKDEYKIGLINRANFSEDDIQRYHYLAYDHRNADNYYGSEVLELFLKPSLRKCLDAKQDHKAALRSFILDYIGDIAEFSQAFASLLEACRSDRRLYTLLVVQGMSALLYPLAIRLHQRGLLCKHIPTQKTGSRLKDTTPAIDLLHCLSVADLRVYKIRGTDPARDIGRLSHRSRKASINDIANGLRDFLIWFMPDSLMKTHLSGSMYGNGSVVPILLAFEQHLPGFAQPEEDQHYSIERLVHFIQQGPTAEHILAQQPSFDFASRGFVDESDFANHRDRLGNLTLLTSRENTRCNNKSPESKMNNSDLYASSIFYGPRLLANEYKLNRKRFDKAAVEMRTEALAEFALANWAIW